MNDIIRKAIFEATSKSPAERLEKALLDNRGTYHINNDGSIVVDFNNPKVQANIKKHLDKLENFKITQID